MSRTFKDRELTIEEILYTEQGPKVKRKFTTKFGMPAWVYGKNPSWFTRLTVTKRRRRQMANFVSKILTTDIECLDLIDAPTNWKKPKEYYW